MPELRAAEPSGLSRDTVEEIAEAFAHQIDYSPDMSLEEMVRPFGGRLTYRDFLNEGHEGSIEVYGFRDFQVFLPIHTSGHENRFTVAHELGHYVLHYLHRQDRAPMFASRYGTGREEQEADWFAPAFLIDQHALKSAVREGVSDFELELKFRVPKIALVSRRGRVA